MTHIVVSEFTDMYSGVRYQPGQRAPTHLSGAQLDRAIAAGCVRDIDIDALTPAGRAMLAATGVNLALAEEGETAEIEAGRAAHGEALAQLQDEHAARRDQLAADLAAEHEQAQAALQTRLAADEASAREAMTAKLAQEEAGLRAEMTARLNEAARASEQAETGTAGGGAPAPGGATADAAKTGAAAKKTG